MDDSEHTSPPHSSGRSHAHHTNDAKRDEDIRAAYQAAVTLWTHASQLIRERLNALLLANSITLLGIVGLLAAAQPLRLPAIGLSLAGLALCAFGFLSLRRSRDLMEYYRDSVIELEQHLDHVSLAWRGKHFASGNAVFMRIPPGGGETRRKMGRLGRIVSAGRSENLLLLAFALTYLIFLIQAFTLETGPSHLNLHPQLPLTPVSASYAAPEAR